MATTSVTARAPSYFAQNPVRVFISAATALAFFALTPEPPLLPVTALLAVSRLSAQYSITRTHGYAKLTLQAGLGRFHGDPCRINQPPTRAVGA